MSVDTVRTTRARVGLVLWPLLILAGLGMATDEWLHRDDPMVWGQFVATSEPCSGKGCATTGDWRANGDDRVFHDVLLQGDTQDNRRVRAAYRGTWPPAAGDAMAVTTQAAMDGQPWLELGLMGGATVGLARDLHVVRTGRCTTSGRPGRRAGAHRPGRDLRADEHAPAPGLTARELIERRRHLPRIDADELRRDIDEIIDQRLRAVAYWADGAAVLGVVGGQADS